MECPECKIVEMRVDRVEDEVMHFVCKKCGKEIEKKIQEVEEENS